MSNSNVNAHEEFQNEQKNFVVITLELIKYQHSEQILRDWGRRLPITQRTLLDLRRRGRLWRRCRCGGWRCWLHARAVVRAYETGGRTVGKSCNRRGPSALVTLPRAPKLDLRVVRPQNPARQICFLTGGSGDAKLLGAAGSMFVRRLFDERKSLLDPLELGVRQSRRYRLSIGGEGPLLSGRGRVGLAPRPVNGCYARNGVARRRDPPGRPLRHGSWRGWRKRGALLDQICGRSMGGDIFGGLNVMLFGKNQLERDVVTKFLPKPIHLLLAQATRGWNCERREDDRAAW